MRPFYDWLVREVTAVEIKKVVLQCDPDKAPGPDGFNAAFYQRNWAIIGKEVTLAIKSFFQSGLLKSLNHTFLTLVPKSTHATQLYDY